MDQPRTRATGRNCITCGQPIFIQEDSCVPDDLQRLAVRCRDCAHRLAVRRAECICAGHRRHQKNEYAARRRSRTCHEGKRPTSP